MKLKRTSMVASILVLTETAVAHSGEDTSGIELHHVSAEIWVLLALVLTTLIYTMYVKSHDKPFNPLEWR